MATALIDRLPRHCHSDNIRRNSYWMRQHTDLITALRNNPATTEAETSP